MNGILGTNRDHVLEIKPLNKLVMDLRYKLIIAGFVDALALDYIIFPGLTMADSMVNLISVGIGLLLMALNYWFFTEVENKWDS